MAPSVRGAVAVVRPKMIQNPATAVALIDKDPEIDVDDLDVPVHPSRPAIMVRQIPKVDYDKVYDDLIHTVNTRITDVDVKLIESTRGGEDHFVHYKDFNAFMSSPQVRARVRDHISDQNIKELRERTIRVPMDGAGRLREGGWDYGLYPDETSSVDSNKVFQLQDTVLPGLNSPSAKEQLWVDYLDSHRKCWEAAVRNPIAKRICRIIPQFVLGRGVKGESQSPKHQAAWDHFWKMNGMQLRNKMLLRELITYGEIFCRYFRTREGLALRSIDPSTIWDIITHEDDIERVRYYHQQYTIQNYSPVVGYAASSKLVIRQIPAREVDHFTINRTHSEKRGRSELFAILGWLLRFKEFANDRVLLNKMRAMFALDVSVEGGASDVASVEAQFATPPDSGAVLVHNSAVKTEFKNANNNANEAKTDAEMILKIIAIGAGVSEQFLGVAAASTRAGALIQTEPDVKNFEDYQEIVEAFLMMASERVFKNAGLNIDGAVMEFTFPSIAQEDRSTKLKDLGFAESMDWFSKERAANMAAREFQVSSYDHKKEQEDIRQANGADPVISGTLQQVSKVAPDQPTLPPGTTSSGSSQQPRVTQTSAQMGFSAKKGGGRALANTKATLDRTGFTRGGEKASVAGRKSAGAPQRESRRGWSPEARAKSLATRRARAEARKREQVSAAGTDPSV